MVLPDVTLETNRIKTQNLAAVFKETNASLSSMVEVRGSAVYLSAKAAER